jgi:hypothetical protein
MQEQTVMAEKPETETMNSEAVKGENQLGATEIYIDPVMERRVVTKFDWLVLPQFVIIIILG